MSSPVPNAPDYEFYQAESMAARIVTLLRSERRSENEKLRFAEFPFPAAELRKLGKLLFEAGPECDKIYRAIHDAPQSELDNLEARLRGQLERAEETHPQLIEALERCLFRPVCFEQVWSEELDDIEKSRLKRGFTEPLSDAAEVKDRALDARLLGLSLSGGGVRSATFNLGLLQGMAKHHVLRRVDYLSTVSGGGYIGGWLTAWIKRQGFEEVEKRLKDETNDPRCYDLQAISFLRDYSSYLTPQNGIFSADTWTAGMTWLRNTMLNLIVLLPGLAALLLTPRLLDDAVRSFTAWLGGFGHPQEEIVTLIAVVCQFLIIVRVLRNLKLFGTSGSRSDPRANRVPGFGDTAPEIQRFIILPAFLSAWLCSNRLRQFAWEQSGLAGDMTSFWTHATGIGVMIVVCFILVLYLQVRAGYIQCYLRETRNTLRNKRMAIFLCFFLPLLVAGVKASILYGIYTLFKHWAAAGFSRFNTHVAVWGTPLVLADFAICIGIHIGLMGRNLPDDRREWWSAVASYLGIYAVGILALCSAAFYGPWLAWPHQSLKWGAIVGWAVTTCAGVIAAKSNESKKKDVENVKLGLTVRAIAVGAPYVFMIGLFLCVSSVLYKLMFRSQLALSEVACGPTGPWALFGSLTAGVWNSSTSIAKVHGYFSQVESTGFLIEIAFLTILVLVTYWMSRAVNINEFSMHHFYRNRLIRTYLGASHCARRKPNRLTGFDMADDVLMASLRPECEPGLRDFQEPYIGPYPIFNTALNLVHGERLSWQERKAASFIFTPRFCGYDYQSKAGTHSVLPLRRAGYRPTSAYAYPDGGVHLGTAMAISGAAASPNAGFHTSSAMAFLLTVLNVRLGWWIGNPRHDVSWRRSGPRHGLMYLIRELFGRADDRQRHVYLSDGGHFENLGIYELVRRRCSVIIASDAEEDPKFSFDGLGGVIRKCFVDFGVRIDIELKDIRPKDGEAVSSQHWVSGLIRYPEGWTGTLIYIKASLVGDEPADLQAYLAKHREFPHQSTANQFFEESQFESYHRLGLHVAKEVFQSRTLGACDWQETNSVPEKMEARAAAAGMMSD
jgi:hypothetical protein